MHRQLHVVGLLSGSWLSGVTDYNSYGYWGLWAYTESSYQALMTTPSANNYFGYGNDPEDFWYYEWGSRNRSEPADLSGVTARWNGQGVGIYSFAGSWNENEFKANVQLEYSASATGPGSLDIGWNKDTVTGLNSTTFTADQKEEVANNFTFWGLSAPTDGSGRWKYDMSTTAAHRRVLRSASMVTTMNWRQVASSPTVRWVISGSRNPARPRSHLHARRTSLILHVRRGKARLPCGCEPTQQLSLRLVAARAVTEVTM